MSQKTISQPFATAINQRKNKIIDDGEEDITTITRKNITNTSSTTAKQNNELQEKVITYMEDEESESDSESYSDSADSTDGSSESDDEGRLWRIHEENGKDVAYRDYVHRGENTNPTSSVVMRTKESKKINFPITVKDNKCSIGVSGYCMIKASHCMESGSYYYEIKIEDSIQCDLSKLPDHARQSHYRCGWSLEQGFDKACCGYDKYSFGYGSSDGNCFHKAKRSNYGENFGVGDVIGCYIEIPEVPMPQTIYIDGSMIVMKTGEVFKTKIATLAEESVPGSKIIFFKNGKFQGIAFSDIPYGAYFPAISLYMNASVTMRFEKNQLEYNPYTICPEFISSNWKPVGDLRYRHTTVQKTPKKTTSSQNEFKTPPTSISKNNLKEIGKGASKQFHHPSPSQNRHSKIASASISENKKPKEKKEKSEKKAHHSGHHHRHHSEHNGGDPKKNSKKKKESKTTSSGTNSSSTTTTTDKPVVVLDTVSKEPSPSLQSSAVEKSVNLINVSKSILEAPKQPTEKSIEKKKKPKPLKVITDETEIVPNKETINNLPPNTSPVIINNRVHGVSSYSDIMPPSPSQQKSPALDTISSPSSAAGSSMKHSGSANSFDKSFVTPTTTVPTTSSSLTNPTCTTGGSASPTNTQTHPPTTTAATTTPVNDTSSVNKPLFITNMSDKPIVQSSFPSIEQITPQTKERKSKSKSEGSSIMARSKNFTPKKVLITKKEDLVAKTAPKRKAPSKEEEPIVHHHHTVKLLDPKDIQQAKKAKSESTTTNSTTLVEKDHQTKPSSPTQNKKRKTSKAESKELSKSKDENKSSSSAAATMVETNAATVTQHAVINNEATNLVQERIIETIVPKQSQPITTTTTTVQNTPPVQQQSVVTVVQQQQLSNHQTQQQYETSLIQPVTMPTGIHHDSSVAQLNNYYTNQQQQQGVQSMQSQQQISVAQPPQLSSSQQQQQQLSNHQQYERSNPEPAYSFSNLLGANTSHSQDQTQLGHQLSTPPNLTQQASQPINNNYNKQDWNAHQLQTTNNAPTNLSNTMQSMRNVVQDISPNYQSRMSLESMLSQKQENMRLLEQINNLPKEIQKPIIQSTTPTIASHTPSFRELLDSPSTTFNPSSNSSQISNTNSNNNNLLAAAAQQRNIPSAMSQLSKVGNSNIVAQYHHQMGNMDQTQTSMASGNYSSYNTTGRDQQIAVNEVKQQQMNQQHAPTQNNFNQYSQRGNYSTNAATTATPSYTPSVANMGSNSSLNFTPHQNVSLNANTTVGGITNNNSMVNMNMGTTTNTNLSSNMASLNQLSNTMMSSSSKFNPTMMQSSQNYMGQVSQHQPVVNHQQQFNTAVGVTSYTQQHSYGGNLKQSSNMLGSQNMFSQHHQHHQSSVMTNQPQPQPQQQQPQQQYSSHNIPRGFAPQQMNLQQLGNNNMTSGQQQMNSSVATASNTQHQQQYPPSMHQQQHQQNLLPNSVNNFLPNQQHYQQQQLHTPQSNQQQSSFKYNYLNK